MSILLNSHAPRSRGITSITAVSVGLLVLSLAAPERAAEIIAAIALAGLMLIRLLNLHSRWPNRRRSRRA